MVGGRWDVDVWQEVFGGWHLVYLVVKKVFCVLDVFVAIMPNDFSIDLILVLAGVGATIPHANAF